MPFAKKDSLNIPYPAWAKDGEVRDDRDFENWKELMRWADRLVNELETAIADNAQLLCMSATGASISPGGGYVTFDSILDQYQFGTVASAGSSWVHPITAVYHIDYEHIWNTYQGGGTIDLELDGIAVPARRIGAGSAWQAGGRDGLSYYAQAGQVGRIKVTHSDPSNQVCNAAVWISVSDPAAGEATVINTAELYINDELVSWTSTPQTAIHNGQHSILVGENNDNPPVASNHTYDDFSLLLNGVEQLGNGGFESADAGNVGATSPIPASVGNWKIYDPGASTAGRVGSPIHAGAWAMNINAVTGNPNNIVFYQDAPMTQGAAFELEFWVYRTAGTNSITMLFEWDRVSVAEQSVQVSMGTASTTVSVFDGSLSAAPVVPYNEWVKIRFVMFAQEVA